MSNLGPILGGDGKQLGGDVPGADARKPANLSKEEFLGVTLRGWAISAISAIAVLSAAITASFALYQNFQDHKRNDAKNRQVMEDLGRQVHTVSQETREKISEAEKHLQMHEVPRQIPIDQGGANDVSASYYPSDGCLRILREHGSHGPYGISDSQDLWIPDPSRANGENNTPTHSGVKEAQGNASQVHEQLETVRKIDPKAHRVEFLASRSSQQHNARLKAAFYQGSCLNPHPGTFQVSNTQVNACEVQVWRRFVDGCTHYQMYNACNGQWAPGVVWQFCAAQHRW